ncbi:MAG TPA: hypothetical protein VHI75_11750, partial [Casimicrobiaceae bacterium]|nr:hypothetical protein [Casimicrobiaceae bacterium]
RQAAAVLLLGDDFCWLEGHGFCFLNSTFTCSLRSMHDIINSDKAVVIGKNARVETVQEHE